MKKSCDVVWKIINGYMMLCTVITMIWHIKFMKSYTKEISD